MLLVKTQETREKLYIPDGSDSDGFLPSSSAEPGKSLRHAVIDVLLN